MPRPFSAWPKLRRSTCLVLRSANSIHVEKSLGEVDGIANSMTILVTDSATTKIYGHVKHVQRTKGLMIPDNDLWIASTALQYGLTLAARDQHFTWITGLALEQW